MKLNSLSPEPSHSARIIAILFYSFILMRELELKRIYRLLTDCYSGDILIWFCFLYAMLTMGSGTAYIFLSLFLLRFVSIPTIFWGGGALFLFVILTPMLDIKIFALDRAIRFCAAIFFGTPDQLVNLDLSASIRVLPVYYYFKQLDFFTFDFWLGQGIDYNVKLFPFLIPGIPVGHSIGGVMPTLLLNHGMIAGVSLILMIFRTCLWGIWSYSALFMGLLLFSCGINMQITWLIITLMATNKYFEKRKTTLELR